MKNMPRVSYFAHDLCNSHFECGIRFGYLHYACLGNRHLFNFFLLSFDRDISYYMVFDCNFLVHFFSLFVLYFGVLKILLRLKRLGFLNVLFLVFIFLFYLSLHCITDRYFFQICYFKV